MIHCPETSEIAADIIKIDPGTHQIVPSPGVLFFGNLTGRFDLAMIEPGWVWLDTARQTAK